MPIKITFVDPHGQRHVLDADPGQSVMKVAVQNGVPGIDADCGGSCACATCHVHIDPAWSARVGTAGDDEQDMLSCAVHLCETSRLSCQIRMSAALNGLIIHIPSSQR